MFSTGAFIPRIAISVLIPIIYFTVAALLPTDDEHVFIYMLGLTFVCAVLYLVPFAANVFYLKNNPNESLKEFILSDLLFVALPACFSTVIVACAFYLFGTGGDSNNTFAVILCVIFAMIPPLAWCFYWFRKKLSKLGERLGKMEQLLQGKDEE